MNFNSMQEVRDYAAVNPDLGSDFHSALSEARKKGILNHADLLKFFRELWTPWLEVKLRRWLEGNLFFSQKASFDAWLTMTHEMIYIEDRDWSELIGTLDALEQEKPEGIQAFHSLRIIPTMLRERAKEDDKLRMALLDKWDHENRKFHWDWR